MTSPSNRAQRASARGLANPPLISSAELIAEADTVSSQQGGDTDPIPQPDDDGFQPSRSTSAQLVGDSSEHSESGRTVLVANGKEKGKGRAEEESENAAFGVKEEPETVQISEMPATHVSRSSSRFYPSM